MKYTQLIFFSVLLLLFSTLFSGSYAQLLSVDKKLKTVRRKSDSLIFISESFSATCGGKGFSSLNEWEEVCRALWELESIEWKLCNSSENEIYLARWSGPYGSGEVYSIKKTGEER